MLLGCDLIKYYHNYVAGDFLIHGEIDDEDLEAFASGLLRTYKMLHDNHSWGLSMIPVIEGFRALNYYRKKREEEKKKNVQ